MLKLLRQIILSPTLLISAVCPAIAQKQDTNGSGRHLSGQLIHSYWFADLQE